MIEEPVSALLETTRDDYWEGSPTPLPDEWVLRELPRLNLDDPATFATLIETYGNVIGPEPFALLPRDLLIARPDVVGSQDQANKLSDLPRSYVIATAVARLHFESLRALVAHVVNYQRGRSLATAWKALDWPLPDGLVKPRSESWLRFEWALNAALRPFSTHVRTTHNPVRYSEPPLYAIAALQVFNVLVEGLPVLTCANEPCQRWFQRQHGRAVYSQHRTRGVMFCSHQCADAQRQRERRRRQ